MSINKKIIFALAAGSLFSVSSCKKYLDVNKNPNVVEQPTVQTSLTAGELITTSSLGVDLEITGSIWGQYWTQNPGASQYHSLDQYAPNADQFSYPWANLYNANENFHQLYVLADSQKKKQYMAISLLMQAYTFQLITDGWGDIPFSQALKGEYSDGHIVNPKYDAQMAVYQGIIAFIDSANKLLDPTDIAAPTTDDLIYGGNMTEWEKFSNTLLLRVYMRMSSIDAGTAGAGITALYAYAAAHNGFIGEGDDALINYGYSTANKNPLNAEMTSTILASTQNLVGSSTCIDAMNSNDDYRAYIFYEYLPSTGAVAGIPQGQYGGAAPAAGTISIPSQYVGADAQNAASAKAPVKLITSYESLFLQSEAQVRFIGGDGSAEFAAGIHASFYAYQNAFNDMNLQLTDAADSGTSYAGNPVGDIFLTADYAYYSYINGDTLFADPADPLTGAAAAQYPTGGTADQKVQAIITQKWFSMCGNQGFEAWTEWRRTGYPSFFTVSLSAANGGTMPRRLTYPTTESTTNSNFPGIVPLTTKVWWDVI